MYWAFTERRLKRPVVLVGGCAREDGSHGSCGAFTDADWWATGTKSQKVADLLRSFNSDERLSEQVPCASQPVQKEEIHLFLICHKGIIQLCSLFTNYLLFFWQISSLFTWSSVRIRNQPGELSHTGKIRHLVLRPELAAAEYKR